MKTKEQIIQEIKEFKDYMWKVEKDRQYYDKKLHPYKIFETKEDYMKRIENVYWELREFKSLLNQLEEFERLIDEWAKKNIPCGTCKCEHDEEANNWCIDIGELKSKITGDCVEVAQSENHSPQEVEQVSTRAPDKEITEDPQVGCGKKLSQYWWEQEDKFCNEFQLCPECEKQGVRENE